MECAHDPSRPVYRETHVFSHPRVVARRDLIPSPGYTLLPQGWLSHACYTPFFAPNIKANPRKVNHKNPPYA